MKLPWLAGFASAICVLFLIGKTSAAEVYVYRDKNGVLNFVTDSCAEGETKQNCVAARLWEWRDDINGDGKVTIGDVDGWIKWIIYYPGDWLIYSLLNDGKGKTAEFFELTPSSYGGWGSLAVSLMLWFGLLVGIV